LAQVRGFVTWLAGSEHGREPLDPDLWEEVGPVEDERLRLIFTCCHPALSTEAQIALTFRGRRMQRLLLA